MEDVFSLIQAVVPEVNDALIQRLEIMKILHNVKGRIGRKMIAERLGMTERASRTLIEHMREQGLVDINQQGVTLTHFGLNTMIILQRLLTDSNSERFLDLELKMRNKLGVDHCRVVAGNGDIDETVFEELGHSVQDILIRHLPHRESVIAVSGGSTLAKVGKQFTAALSQKHDITFVPTRGGFSGSYDIQSNTIGGIMAQQTNSRYVPLFAPENVSKETSHVLQQDPSIHRAIELSKRADSLLISVGTAEVMAERRDIDDRQRQFIADELAVGEVFGVFFNEEGQPILRYPRMGMQLEDIDAIPLLITVVAGESKAKAIEAYYKLAPKQGWLVCDESLANKIIYG